MRRSGLMKKLLDGVEVEWRKLRDIVSTVTTISKIKETFILILFLEKQKEIVAILDKFDALTQSITEGLPHEIELREKQYEYYRDRLLTFGGKNGTKA